MSSEDPTSLSKSHSYSKYLKKDKWRSKVAAMKAPKEQDHAPPPPANDAADIDDFLRPSTMKARPVSPKPPRIGIDVAAARQAPAGEGLTTPSIARKRDYPRRALNLRVAFANSPPTVIGAGGEESEEPTMEISKARFRLQNQAPVTQRSFTEFNPYSGESQARGVCQPALPAPPQSRALDPASEFRDNFADDPCHSSFPTEEPGFVPNPIKRAPTLGVNTTFDEQQNPRPSMDSDAPSSGAPSSAGVGRSLTTPSRNFQLPESNSVMANSPLDVSNMRAARRQSTLESPVIQEKINKMRQEEEKALHAALHDKSPFDGGDSSRFSSPTIGSTVRSSEDINTGPTQAPDHQPRSSEDNFSRQHQSSDSQHFSSTRQPEDGYSRSVQTSGSQRTSRVRSSEHQHNKPVQSNGSESQRSEASKYNLASVAEQLTSQSRPGYTQAFSYEPQEPQHPTPSPLTSFPTPGYATPGIQRGLSMRKPVPIPSPQTAASQFMPAQESSLQSSPLHNLRIPQTPDYFSASPRAAEHPAVDPKDVKSQVSRNGLNDGISQNEANAEPEPFSATSSVASKSQYAPYIGTSTRPRPDANPSAAFGQMALEDFADRCSHMDGIFRLQAEFERPIGEFTPIQWLRNAAWWFLKGRAGIEGMVRALPRGVDGRPQSQQGETLLSQPHVDLAKCWWILDDVIVNHAALRGSTSLSRASEYGKRSSEARSAGDQAMADLFESADVLMANLRAVLSSMKRNNVMPPTHALIQGQDQSVWVRHANLSPSLLPILSGNMGRSLTEAGNIQHFSPLSVMAVGETRNDFSYTSMFVKATLGTNDENSERIALPCLLSVMRERNDWHQKVAICTQKEIVTLCIQGDRRRGPSWKDVKWNEQTFGLLIQLPHGYSLALQLSEIEFKQLYTSYNHNYRVQSSLLPRSNEQIIYEVSLRDFQYTDSNKPPAFPSERMKRCRIRVFARVETRVEGTGERKFYRGFRILAITSPKNKVLGSASHEIGFRSPILLTMASDAASDGAPAMTLEVQEGGRQCHLLMVFNHAKDCHGLWNTLNNSIVGPDEMQCAALQLKTISVESIDPLEAYGPASRNPLGRLTWQELIVINSDPRNPEHDIGQTVLSDNLRIISQAAAGTMTDRVNVGPGEMRIRLQTDGGSELVICRPPQDDLSLSLDSASKDPYIPKELNDVQRAIFMHSSIRTYSFFSLQDLHVFERAITGFKVRYDGVASAFSIARRRAVTALSKHKKIEATKTRIQIVSHENGRMVQLLAFFDDLPQTDALNFQLKGVDVFERHEGKTGKGKYGVKMVDVKFSLPKLDKEEKALTADGKGRVERKFVSLDMLEPPAENDDVVVGFEDEAERERRPAQEAVEIHYLSFKVRALRLEPSLFSHLFHFNAYARDAEMPEKQLRHIKAVRIRPPVKIIPVSVTCQSDPKPLLGFPIPEVFYATKAVDALKKHVSTKEETKSVQRSHNEQAFGTARESQFDLYKREYRTPLCSFQLQNEF
ncbi:hypothetical protein EG327_011365 [Venturia inaequalis]|uniref:Uncharacterized protein n=1 Tax=Venturia inaequalis TaxID=5025 RepID=A0A8H3VQA7_VENIN|nr:hypothetical protein EG327_011365 [Venturia inaequalis]